jgi:hypothetical protein
MQDLTLVLCVAETHPLFADTWTDTQRAAHRVLDDGQSFLPVIPLLGSAAAQPATAKWPGKVASTRFDERKMAALLDAEDKRYDAVTARLAEEFTRDRWWARQALKFFHARKKHDALKKIETTVGEALSQFGLR